MGRPSRPRLRVGGQTHPTAGPLAFDIEIVAAPHEPDQTLVVCSVEPDSPTARVLPILASWAGSVTR